MFSDLRYCMYICSDYFFDFPIETLQNLYEYIEVEEV